MKCWLLAVCWQTLNSSGWGLGLAGYQRLRLSIPDGQVRNYQEVLTRQLSALLQPCDCVFSTWALDGHPDHEATAEAAAAAAAAIHAGCRYEARKHELTLACLPQLRYRRAYEPGCANGELAAALALRCDALIASDGTAAAVALAQARLAEFTHVEVHHAWVPDDWPEGALGLVVVSELLGYYLAAPALAQLASRQSS